VIDGRENMQVTTASSDFIMNPENTNHKSNTQQVLPPVEEVNSDDLEATTKKQSTPSVIMSLENQREKSNKFIHTNTDKIAL
jgi:hypothetical protein